MIYFNYITTNKVNNKKYVGSHSTNNLIRDRYLGSGKLIKRAIKKYGRGNFTRDILNRVPTQKEAFHNEKFFIVMYMTLSPNGYNLSPLGGLGEPGCHSEETKRKIGLVHKGKKASKETKIRMSEARKGKIPWIKGRYHSDETKKKIGEKSKEKIPWNKGIPWSEEVKQKNSNSQKGEKGNFYGKKHSIEARKKISDSKIGKKRKPFSEKAKQNIGKAMKGKKRGHYKKKKNEYI